MKRKKATVFYNGIIHTGVTETQSFYGMLVAEGRIRTMFSKEELKAFAAGRRAARVENRKTDSLRLVNLQGKHVYPCLIDGHLHLMLTIAVMAMGFNICEITAEGVKPNCLEGIRKRLETYASGQKKDAIIACSNYIGSAIAERRMPGREELDLWCGGRPVVIYNIDGHSSALSSAMLSLVGLDPAGHSGILSGEDHEKIQGRLVDILAAKMTPALLARGIAEFQNQCASYGIGLVGALEGNGDSEKDITTVLIAHLARHFDQSVRLYLQYRDLSRIAPFLKLMKKKKAGGCGEWEMDGSVGSHSAAFSLPYLDTGEKAACYYSQEAADQLVLAADRGGYQISSHAIGELAVRRLLLALEKTDHKLLHRVEHCEFILPDSLEILKKKQYAVMVQPGYSWIDKRYLHTYEQHLPEEILNRMWLKELYDAGVCVCGSSDSPVQDMDPFLQMLGMVQFYREEESITPYQAFTTYTSHAAKAMLEEDLYGTLEAGKRADFFLADRNFFTLALEEVVDFRPLETWYAGEKYREKKGSIGELLLMLLRKPKPL